MTQPNYDSSEAELECTRDHLDEIDGGDGCTEIWEKLSEYRTETNAE